MSVRAPVIRCLDDGPCGDSGARAGPDGKDYGGAMGGRGRGFAGAVVAVLVAAVAVAVTVAPAAATLWFVGDEASYRSALTVASSDNTGPHTIEITADFTITGATDPTYSGAQPLTIDGNDHFLSGGVTRRILAHTSTAALTVNDLQLSNGKASGPGGAISAGGSVTVTDTIFTNNMAGGGGAISATGSVTATNSSFTYNTASGGGAFSGGGGAIRSAASVTVAGSTFSFNIATGDDIFNETYFGGGGAVKAALSVTATGSTFTYNNATGDDFANGGAINAGLVTVGLNTPGSVTATNSTIANNSASLDGGGIHAESVTTANSTLANNTATRDGGALYAGAAMTTNSTFMGNTARAGGAIFGIGSVTATNSTLTGGNTATTSGGAIVASGMTLVHATVVGNTAVGGSNLVSTGEGLDSFGSVVALPLGGGANCNVDASGVSTYSYADDLSCGFDDVTDDQAAGNDPQLQALANNGGSTLTRAPQATSPLVDAIPNAACDPAVTTDQRGATRPADGDVDGTDECDIGAVEHQPPAARPDARIKRGAAGALQGNNIYNTLTGQTVSGSAARGRSITYFASVQNDAAFTEPLRVRGQASTTNFTVVYRNPAGVNITGAVTSVSGYTTPDLATGATHPIKVVVTVRNTAPRNASTARTLTAISTIRPPIKDTVRFITNRS